MSFDFFPEEGATTMLRAARTPSLEPEPSMWRGFLPGAASLTMQGFAKTARAVDLLGSIGPILEDRLTGGTTEQDRYFKEHDEFFNRAVDYWTPAPGTVGTAGQIAGSLIPTLSTVMLSPGLAVGTAELGTAEDLTRAGVAWNKALKAGIVQGTGLGAGILMPILGNSLATRMLVGGAGFNVVQGIATKLATQKVLEGEKAAEGFNPWDAEGIALDALMGIGFGALAHIGATTAEARMTQTDKDALLVANQARHLENSTAPGIPKDAAAQTAHVAAVKQAVDDLLSGRAVNVEQALQGVKFASDAEKAAAAAEVSTELGRQSRSIVLQAIADEQARVAAAEKPGFLRTPEEMLALREPAEAEVNPELARALEIARKPGFQRTAEERITLDAYLHGKGFEDATKPIEPLPRQAAPEATESTPPEGGAKTQAEPGAPKVGGQPQAVEAVQTDPIIAEARARVAERGDLQIPTGATDEAGNPVTRSMRELMDEASAGVEQAQKDAGLFTVAAQCLLGAI